MSRMLSRMSCSRIAGRSKGTDAFPADHLLQARPQSRFFDEIHVAVQHNGETLAQGLKPTKMVEAAS